MISLCEKTGHLIRITKTDRGSGDQYAHCQICGCAVVKGSWNTPWKQPKFKQMPLTEEEIIENCDTWVLDDIGNQEVIKIVRRTERAHGIGVEDE
jgi:hypothetical protein